MKFSNDVERYETGVTKMGQNNLFMCNMILMQELLIPHCKKSVLLSFQWLFIPTVYCSPIPSSYSSHHGGFNNKTCFDRSNGLW